MNTATYSGPTLTVKIVQRSYSNCEHCYIEWPYVDCEACYKGSILQYSNCEHIYIEWPYVNYDDSYRGSILTVNTATYSGPMPTVKIATEF